MGTGRRVLTGLQRGENRCEGAANDAPHPRGCPNSLHHSVHRGHLHPSLGHGHSPGCKLICFQTQDAGVAGCTTYPLKIHPSRAPCPASAFQHDCMGPRLDRRSPGVPDPTVSKLTRVDLEMAKPCQYYLVPFMGQLWAWRCQEKS